MNTVRTLPPLEGPLYAVVRGGYLLLAALTTIIVIGSVIFNGLDFFRNMPAGESWGLRTFSSVKVGAPPYLGWVSPQAKAGGLRVNDVIVAIQGNPLPPSATEFDIGRRLDAVEGSSVTIATRRTDGTVSAHLLQRVPNVWHQLDSRNGLPLWLSSTATFLGIEVIPIFLLGASLLLFSRRPRDPEVMLFATGFLLLCNIPVSDFWLLALLNFPDHFASNLLAAGQCIVIIAAAGFPDGRFDSAWSRMVLIAAVPLTVANRIAHSFAPNAQASGALSAAVLLLLSAVAMIGLSRRYQMLDSSRARQQIKWVLLGFCVSAIASAAYMGLLHANVVIGSTILEFVSFQLLQLLAFVALPLGLVVSLLRYRLYDAEATISRSAAYAMLTVSLVVLFAATEKLIELVGSNVLGGNVGAIAGGTAAGVAAVMIAPLHHRIGGWAKRRFQHDLVRLREGLPVLVGDMREVASSDQVARAALERIVSGVHACRVALIINGKLLAARDVNPEQVATWQADHTIEPVSRVAVSDPLFPLRVPVMIEEETRMGYLLLGPRPDGSFYGMDELATLDEIAGPIARALMICQQREAADGDAADKMRLFEDRLALVEQILARQK